MSQQRLNHNAIPRVHKDILDELDLTVILNEFSLGNEGRKRHFGISKFT